jgi:hypothetical protein
LKDTIDMTTIGEVSMQLRSNIVTMTDANDQHIPQSEIIPLVKSLATRQDIKELLSNRLRLDNDEVKKHLASVI